ncbi:unnamed protein product [Peniophora sp. CBMAI 1063]|nr:unnamed protein product [Peniophora sp. CBMAI 1063]
MLAPEGHLQVQRAWKTLCGQGSDLFQRFMRSLAIETNHVESTFLVTVGSSQDLVRSGIVANLIVTNAQSEVKDPTVIKSILNDTLGAYELLRPLVQDLTKLSPEAICEVHRRLLDTARFRGRQYIPTGVMRTATRKSVYIHGGPKDWIQCCPPSKVDDEMFYICETAQKYIREARMDPFALAAWLHLVLVRCHPFNDGNGRTARLISSIPLIKHGYPPISIPYDDRGEYLKAIDRAYKNDFQPLATCFLKGMQTALNAARKRASESDRVR